MPATTPLAVITGLSGLRLTDRERDFFREISPFGFILFGRNVDTPAQVRALCDSLRETTGRDDTPILIDQEGGRVQRLKAPHWAPRPPGEVFGRLFERNPEAGAEALRLNTRLIARDLTALGIDTDCLPVLDVRHPGAHDVVGDRAFSTDPKTVSRLGRIVIDTLLDNGVFPVMKHIPGHGRSECDSHDALPRVTCSHDDLTRSDLVPFSDLRDCPFAMTAHIVYTACDSEQPATLSAEVIRSVIRGQCGFDGLLMTDDLSMKALSGTMESRTRASLDAGCDLILHCNGAMDEMTAVARTARPMDAPALERWERAKARRAKAPADFDAAGAQRALDLLLEQDTVRS
ncbi:beta-N-acetylhexosaminidase [Phaeovibrio sulfidiphilus]|uniref:beta-N-acetylhexosaminidase n=1 Tax=Phaeovibrio sulfidiphilus TaxID=1220600 RepID=A0A8J6YN76_9PROT|nr:beta-N-acetylhexosaminidase [Phaeovibrio sulfidiphilus]MBE1237595.1 beta-N-acetylhexosaminidase [Phaeovibrio sulfidiphilus]